jgi:hypothetical protein
MESKIESLEARIRELERDNAKLHGQVQEAYADALKTVFFDQRRDRVGHSDGIQGPRGESLPDSSSLSIK